MNYNSIKFINSKNIESISEKFGGITRLNPIPLRRQMLTAHNILRALFLNQDNGINGMLLADDVGLGKTSIGAIVAWVAASAGEGLSVRILAPNMTIKQRWDEELKRVHPAFRHIAKGLDAKLEQISHTSRTLKKRQIDLTTRSRAVNQRRISGDLIIVDEAHRSKSPTSNFRKMINNAVDSGSKLLFITATPMSISPRDIADLLRILGGDVIGDSVLSFGSAISDLYNIENSKSVSEIEIELDSEANRATSKMALCVIRHSVDDLNQDEQNTFSTGRKDWSIEVPPASLQELELLARADRLLRLGHPRGTRSNDPQFHVARGPLKIALDKVEGIV